MTTLCIDELPARLKRRWNWPASATHVAIEADCPLLDGQLAARAPAEGSRSRAAVPDWLKPARGHAGPPGVSAFHGKVSPSVG